MQFKGKNEVLLVKSRGKDGFFGLETLSCGLFLIF